MRAEDIGAYLDAVERSTGKTFRYRGEIETLMTASAAAGRPADFAEVTFLSKFLVNASHILRRAGLPQEETANLTAEFSSAVGQIAALLRRILRSAAEDIRSALERKFLDSTQAALAELLALAEELTRIKNYELDRAARN